MECELREVLSCSCCGCCAAFKPRYKRLVDNIYPVQPQDGLVKSNMDKLTFFALSYPEKLDRIGEYLAQRVSRDIYRRRYPIVIMSMEAMDQLLVACHAQSLNLFVESFLKTVQKLLETPEPELQILASQSFVRFANIEEDTPSYHRRYDFFVSKFAALCHSNHQDMPTRDKLRLAGLKGLQGVVRKTVADDLAENIWDPVHMDKIVPSLLFNMQDARPKPSGSETPENPQEEEKDPPALAETCLRELIGRASFGNIRSVVQPVFKHLDLHELWVPNDFAVYTFRIIMFSIQAQYSYAVVEILMSHLDLSARIDAKVRTSLADVLSKIIAIVAGESVGPSVLEIINSLLKHLRASVSHSLALTAKGGVNQEDEKQYQEALMNALAEFANHLPSYQKVEIMMFILGKVPVPLSDAQDKTNNARDVLLQNMLLKCLLKVSIKYETRNYSTTFPLSFLEHLLRLSLTPDPEVRLLVQRILHTLLDRHGNKEKLLRPTLKVKELQLNCGPCSRADATFIKKHASELLGCILDNLELPSNGPENLEALQCTMSLICVELACEASLCEFLRLLLSVQDVALSNNFLKPEQRCCLHVMVLSIAALLGHVLNLAPFLEYVNKVTEERLSACPFLVPGFRIEEQVNLDESALTPPGNCLLGQDSVTESLKASGVDASGVQVRTSFPLSNSHRYSWGDSVVQPSNTDLSAISVDVESAASSPGIVRKQPEEELTYAAFKKVMTEPQDVRREADLERRQYICDTFKNAPFQELIAFNKGGVVLQETLEDILSHLTVNPVQPKESNEVMPGYARNSLYDVQFPELFVY